MSSFFLEIHCEEIPASFVDTGISYLKSAFEKLLFDNKIEFASVNSGGTPRRLYLYVDEISDKQKDVSEEIVGPPASIAFDSEGNLTQAAVSFAKAKGIDITTIKKIDTKKGEYLSGTKNVKGGDTKEFLQSSLPVFVQSLPFRKTMKWGDGFFRFARPVKSFISLYNCDVLAFEVDGITAGRMTTGHRFLSNGNIIVDSYDDYINKMEMNSVILDIEKRKELIVKGINEKAKENNFIVNIDEDLLSTVVNLVEYPFVVMGEFSKDFLQLPSEALITSMKNHQKYFYALDSNEVLTNKFIGISNMPPVNDNIKQGYERVLRARLSDGMFFYENDKAVSLDSRSDELKKVVYQEKLGTSYEKMDRFKNIALYISEKIGIIDKHYVERAAHLCKADLMTEMVYEFPELQGVMGREYAKIQGEPEPIYEAIFEHYLPRFSGDILPKTEAGAVVSISDKIDTICGCFGINLIPTGNNDPYALRRCAIGILQIIRDKRYRFNMKALIDNCLLELSKKISFDRQIVAEKVYDFIMQRFKQILSSENISGDIFDAVNSNFCDIITIEKAAKSLSEVKGSVDFESIAASYKRTVNILKKSEVIPNSYSEELFESDAEKNLAAKIGEIKLIVEGKVKEEDFSGAISALISVKEPVDEFFNSVMVMSDNIAVKNNRLSLLSSLKGVFDSIGDVSLIN